MRAIETRNSFARTLRVTRDGRLLDEARRYDPPRRTQELAREPEEDRPQDLLRIRRARARELGERVAIGTMHLAKGLEFKVVAVMACDDEVIPLAERIDAVVEESDLDDVYETERHLLYVACTRARDRLLVSAVKPGSEFIQDLGA